MKDDTVSLRYIFEMIRRVEENTRQGKEAFMASHTLQDAVLRNLQTMSETTQRLSETLKATRPDVEWAIGRTVTRGCRAHPRGLHH